MSVRILVAESDIDLQREIRETIRTEQGLEVVGTARDGEEAVQLALNLRPDVVVLDYDLPGITGNQTCEILSALAPDIMAVILSEHRSLDRMEECMHFGARAVIDKSLQLAKLGSILSEIGDFLRHRGSNEVLQWADLTKIPHIISVSGAKGGIGKSTVATNLAVTLAKDLPGKVAIIDLYSQFGDIPTMFNVVPKSTIFDMAPMCKELDVDVVGNYITRHPSGVHVLSMTTKPIANDAVSIECMDSLLYILKRMYRFLVIDVPPTLDAMMLHVLSRSSMVILVSNLLDVTTVTDTHRLYEALREVDVSREVMGLVLNRISRADSLRLDDVKKMFDCRILAEIPSDDRITSAINEGIPLVMSDPSCRFSKGISTLAKAVTDPKKALKKE